MEAISWVEFKMAAVEYKLQENKVPRNARMWSSLHQEINAFAIIYVKEVKEKWSQKREISSIMCSSGHHIIGRI